MKKIKRIFTGIFLVIVVLTMSGLSGCTKKSVANYRIPLEVWIAFDNTNDYAAITREYKELNPHIGEISFRKFQVDNYKKDLIDALATGQGPDIILMQNTWFKDFKDKIEPVPDGLISLVEMEDNFVDVVLDDFTDEGQIYGVPLSVDSLALYYNKDLFNAEGLTSTPKTWEEFNEYVMRLTRVDELGNIVQSGASMGTADNINRSIDILELLMLQYGVDMVDARGNRATFTDIVDWGGQKINAAQSAMDYYTQFAMINKKTYCWNNKLHYSLDAFYEGSLAMMINYSWHYNTIKAKNAKLNFAVAEVPQLSGDTKANHANYWAFAVTKNKKIPRESISYASEQYTEEQINYMRVFEAWQLLKYMTTKNNGSLTLINAMEPESMAQFPVTVDPAEDYLELTQKPAARKDLIEQQKDDPFLKPFVLGNLNARSWRHNEPEEVEKVFAQSINDVITGQSTAKEAMDIAQTRVTRLLQD